MVFRHYKELNQRSSVRFNMLDNLTTSLDSMPTSITTLLEHSASKLSVDFCKRIDPTKHFIELSEKYSNRQCSSSPIFLDKTQS